MKATVSEIGIFTSEMPGQPCPRCGGESVLLSTTNEWRNWCKACDIRFTDKGEIRE